DAARQRATRRLEAFLAAEASRRLAGLRRLEAAVAEGTVKGLARGLAYRLIEAGGVIDRATVSAEARALSQVERRMLRSLGVRLGAFSIFMPGLFKPQARALVQALASRETDGWRPAIDRPSRLPDPLPSPRTLSAFGLRAVRGLAVPVEQLERLDELMREGEKKAGGIVLSEAGREELGWTEAETFEVLRGLGFAPANRPKAGEPTAWRRRAVHAEGPAPSKPHSPFAALAALQAQPPPPIHRPRKRRGNSGQRRL
ncbi:MAG TPA: phosphonate-binding protein, partial [Phenylobacterium sp.]|nr:phosphonate-binding protein [Phenylobacterium sp.]